MAYSTNGDADRNGKRGEQLVAEQISKNEDFANRLDSTCDGPVEKLGGTQYVADLKFGKANISAKTKSSNSGTTDWTNTSILGDSSAFDKVKAFTGKVRGTHADTIISRTDAKKTIISETKGKLNELTDQALSKLSPSFIRSFVKGVYETRMCDLDIVFNMVLDDELLHFKGDEHPVGDFLKAKGEFFLEKFQKSSYQSRNIMFRDARGVTHRTGLRLRLVLNNGMGALLAGKKWSSNPTSVLTLKIQQEDHKGLFSYLQGKNKLNKFDLQ